MTNFEEQQANNIFIEAGKLGFSMRFHSSANPYSGRFLKLWLSGYKNAEYRAGGKTCGRIRKSYSVPDLAERECPGCGDTFIDKSSCMKCLSSGDWEKLGVKPLDADENS